LSHVTQAETVFTSLDDLEAAAARDGGTLHRNRKHVRWFTSGFVDDSKEWKAFFSAEEAARIAKLSKVERVAIINKEMNKADHVISYPGVPYDVGVHEQKDGTFRLRWDYYNRDLGKIMGPKRGYRFTQQYGLSAATRRAKRGGWRTSETKKPNGEVELELLKR